MMEFLYKTKTGRFFIILLQKLGAFKLGAWILKKPVSCHLIPGYIRKNQIDMMPYEGQNYPTFEAFFARTREKISYEIMPEALISPCDGLLSIYPIKENMSIPMKGSWYRLQDIVPDRKLEKEFQEGLFLVFRLQAKDYHHFCCFDDMKVDRTGFCEGKLHSVQPIACEHVPVYRLNRRWWSILDTAHFGKAIQVEIGAMLVGGLTWNAGNGWMERGSELGNFELAGSTIVLILNSSVRKKLEFREKFKILHGEEMPVTMGEGIGVLKHEEETENL